MSTWTPTPRPAPLPVRLGRQIYGHELSRTEAAREIIKGLPTQVLEKFLNAFPLAATGIYGSLDLSERTLSRRRQAGRLTAAESDRLYRLISLYLQATDVLEDAPAADRWMVSPAPALGNQTPLASAGTEAGSKEVSDLLTRIDHGVYS